MNPRAIAFWIALTCVGFLINGVTGAVVGLLIGVSLSLLVEVFS